MKKTTPVASKKMSTPSKKATSTASPKKTAKVVKLKAPKEIKHNKRFPIQKVSRTELVNVIKSTKGRFFTSTHIDKENCPRTMNAIKSNKPQTELGYITVYSMRDKGLRNINPQTLTDVSFNGVHYMKK